MPFRLIFFLITLVVIVTFIGLNIENHSDIRLWFGDNGLIKDVPIFVSLFIVYVLGVLSVIPSILVWMFRRKRENKSERDSPDNLKSYGKNSARKSKSADREENSEDENPDEDPGL